MADENDTNPEAEVDIQFKPVVELAAVEIDPLENDEEEIFKMRAKLFRFDNVADSPEWKDRGIGEIRMLKHKTSHHVRLLMRREKVMKICCNHFLTKAMKLKPHASSDKAFIWTTLSDYADEEIKQELLAIRFRDAEQAQKFRTKFEELQAELPDLKDVKIGAGEGKENANPKKDTPAEAPAAAEDVVNKLKELSVDAKGPAGDN